MTGFSPEDKAKHMSTLLVTYWPIVAERLEQEQKSIEAEISLCLKKRNFDRASHLNGKKEMAEYVLGLPHRIRKENLKFIERVKEALSGA